MFVGCVPCVLKPGKMESNIDCRGTLRVRCRSCSECTKFLSTRGTVLCEYCFCALLCHTELLKTSQETKTSIESAKPKAINVSDVDTDTANDNADLPTPAVETSGFPQEPVVRTVITETDKQREESVKNKPPIPGVNSFVKFCQGLV